MTQVTRYWPLVIAALIVLLLYLLQPILTPFVVGAALAYIGDPWVQFFERLKLKRAMAVAVVYLLISLIVLILLVTLVPLLRDQIQVLILQFPSFKNWINSTVVPWIYENLNVNLEHFDFQTAGNVFKDYIGDSNSWISENVSRLARSGMTVLNWVVNLALIPVVTFYLMLDWSKFTAFSKRMIPRKYLQSSHEMLEQIDLRLKAFLKGQVLVIIVLSFFYSVGLSLTGLSLGILLGLFTGIGALIPYVGFTLGLGFSLLAGAFQFDSWGPIAGMLVVFGLGQVLEGWILTPNLVGNKIGLHPVLVIFSVLAGGQLFGFVGMIIALPTAAVLVVVLQKLKEKYLNSDLYLS